MTREEVTQVLAVLKANYSGALKDITRQEAEGKINLWITMFADTDKEMMNLAIRKIIATSKYFPTVAEVREVLAEINSIRVIDSGEAWGEVISAIRNYGWSREGEALENMSENTRNVVKRMGWMNLCKSENIVTDRAHFLKIYESEEKRQKEKNALPFDVLQSIEQKQLEYQKQQQQMYQNQILQKQQQNDVQALLECKPEQTQDFYSVAKLFAQKRKELFGESGEKSEFYI
ncbi:replicative helicase loader/inhibitor [Lachnospiraceae bacterium 46-61]